MTEDYYNGSSKVMVLRAWSWDWEG